MKATKHAARGPRRRLGRTRAAPLALLLAVGVAACVAAAFLVLPAVPGGAGHAAAVSAAPGAAVSAGDPPAGATTTPADGPGPGASPSTTGSARPSAAPTAAATATSSASASTSSASAASAPAVNGGAGAAPATAGLAGRIKPGVANQGVATAYAAGDGNGSCLYGPSADLMVAAMNVTDYESAKACGAYVSVRAANGAGVTVRIVNECPAPCAPGQLDLSQQAFAKLADLSAGRLPISWTLLSPDPVGALSIRYKTGSSKWWCGVQVIGHRNPVAELEVRGTGGWRQLPRTDFNYFVSADGTGCGGELRITDIYGQQLTVDGISVQPDVAQPTGLQFARH